MTTEDLPRNLASNLRFLRERRGLTQSGLAKHSGVPRSTLANLETGGGNPTLAVLGALAGALQISISELLSAPSPMGRVYRRGSLPEVRRGRPEPAEVRKLLPDPIGGMEIDRMSIPDGSRLPGVPHRPGTREYLFCEQGTAVLIASGERYELQTGDVAVFQGDQPHSYRNEGPQPNVLFSVVVLAPV